MALLVGIHITFFFCNINYFEMLIVLIGFIVISFFIDYKAKLLIFIALKRIYMYSKTNRKTIS